MFVIINKYLILKRFDGVVLWPFIFLRRPALKENRTFMNHERIHLRQQMELLLVFFYLWYLVEFCLRYLQYDESFKAYENISFEREAYANEHDLEYMNKRKFWAFLKYL